MTINEEIQFHLDKANEIAFKEFKNLARNVLKKNKNKVYEFIAAHQSFFFTHKNGNILYEHELNNLEGFKELENFDRKWKDFYLSGNGVRFTALSGEKTSW